jgi:tetratricopeptide (TPR) repeat protein
MNKVRLIILFIIVVTIANGQEKSIERIDSLISDANYVGALELINRYQFNDSKAQSLIQNKKAEIYIAQGKLDEAEAVLKKIDLTKDLFTEAITDTNLGFLYLNKARNDLALDYLKQALIKFTEAEKSTSKEAAQCLAHLSSLYLTTGKLNQSLENGLLALQLRQQLFNENSEPIAASYNDLGLVYSQTNPDKALDYYEKALTIYEKLHTGNHPKIAFANTNIGMMYLIIWRCCK